MNSLKESNEQKQTQFKFNLNEFEASLRNIKNYDVQQDPRINDRIYDLDGEPDASRYHDEQNREYEEDNHDQASQNLSEGQINIQYPNQFSENENSQNTDEENDQDLLIKEIECCQNEDDLRILLEIDSSHLILNGDSASEFYKTAYNKNQKRLFNYMKIIKYFTDKMEKQKNSVKCNVQEQKENYQNLKNQLEEMQNQVKEITEINLEREKEFQLYKGNSNEISKQSLDKLNKIENEINQTLKIISEYKNKKIEEIKYQNQSLKDQLQDCKKCIICRNHNISILIQPCNHICLCEDCVTKVNICPLDRKNISTYTKIYLL